MPDLLVKLYDNAYDFSRASDVGGVVIKKAFAGDKAKILDFVRETFPGSPAWVYECEYALTQNPPACYIAVRDKEIVGFACYDASAKGFFGPTGVREDFRKRGIGRALLYRSLWSMRESGYAYAIIGWPASTAVEFYKKTAGAVEIPDSPPEKSIYSNMAARTGGAAVRGVAFAEIADALRHGREVEFAFNKEKYGIVNGGGEWFLCGGTEPRRLATLCAFDEKDTLVEKVSRIMIDGVAIPDIFDRAKHDPDFFCVL